MKDRLHAMLVNNDASFLRLILDNVSDCLVVVDTEGEIVWINRPYCDLLGGSPADFLGRHINEAVSPHSQLYRVARGEKPLLGEVLKVRGQEIITRQVPIWLDGEIIGAVGMALFGSSQQAASALKLLFDEPLVISRSSEAWQAQYTIDDIVGRGPEMLTLKNEIRQAARTSLPVLIHGETGVGKELVAHAIHRLSARSSKPFVWLNCATIPDELVASELFGYDGGAFTGARVKGNRGKLELAHEGTIFLDEIGDMPLHAQAALLRVLQEKQITRVGGGSPVKLKVSVISASHKNLAELVRQGKFREDLLYRLRILEIKVPPVRERSDLDMLFSHLVSRTRIELERNRLSLSQKAIQQLRAHSWPGNVRELQAVIQRATVRLADDEFEIAGFPELSENLSGPNSAPAGSLAEVIAKVERDTIINTLEACRGNRSTAARLLGIDRSSLYKRLRLYGIDNAAAEYADLQSD